MTSSNCTYVLIISDNSMEKLHKTMDSILNQTVEQELLRVLIIDNASEDGTYHKLVEYEIKYPKLVSVIREKQPTTRGRLLKRLIRHLRFAQVGSSLILNPGDIIYPDFIREARGLLQLKEDIRCFIYEVDILEENRVIKQEPIFKNNCILTEVSKDVYYRYGIGHKVQAFYRKLPIGVVIKLPYYEVIAKDHDWLAASFYNYRVRNNVYVRKTAGCICEEMVDTKQRLIEWAFFIKRVLYAVETQVFSTTDAADLEKEEVEAAYRCLAMMALQYSVKDLKRGLFEAAEDALIFAEMMKADIVGHEGYKRLQEAILVRKYEEELEKLFIEESVMPPRICKQF